MLGLILGVSLLSADAQCLPGKLLCTGDAVRVHLWDGFDRDGVIKSFVLNDAGTGYVAAWVYEPEYGRVSMRRFSQLEKQ